MTAASAAVDCALLADWTQGGLPSRVPSHPLLGPLGWRPAGLPLLLASLSWHMNRASSRRRRCCEGAATGSRPGCCRRTASCAAWGCTRDTKRWCRRGGCFGSLQTTATIPLAVGCDLRSLLQRAEHERSCGKEGKLRNGVGRKTDKDCVL